MAINQPFIAQTAQRQHNALIKDRELDETASDLWSAIRAVLPDTEELALAVASAVGEPIESVRASVMLGAIAMNGQLGPEAAASAQIEIELRRSESAQSVDGNDDLVSASSIDQLLAETNARQANRSLDLRTIVEIQRASGAIAARAAQRLDLLLHRYAVTRRLIWDACVSAAEEGRLERKLLAQFGRFLLLWNELTSLAATDGYRTAEREILARTVEARRGALQEILGVVSLDAAGQARLRRLAARYGLDPDGTYRLVAIAADESARPASGPPGIGEDELEVFAGRISYLLGSTPLGAAGAGAGVRLPVLFPLMGRIALVAEARSSLARLPTVLDEVLAFGQTPWLAVGSRQIVGVDLLAAAYADLVDATRTGLRLAVHGWIEDPEQLALERLLLANRTLADAAVRRELGPILADERFGRELVETLQAYFDAGENVTATARKLHLATRTVGYRLEKVEALLGRPLDDENGRRLATALLVYRLRSSDEQSSSSSRPDSSAIESGG